MFLVQFLRYVSLLQEGTTAELPALDNSPDPPCLHYDIQKPQMANASMHQMLVMIIDNFVLFCSFISSQTLIGAPTEIYFYGTIFMYQCIGSFIGALIGFVFFLPVFKQLNIISVYEVCLHSQMHALSLLNYYCNNDKFMAFRWSKNANS